MSKREKDSHSIDISPPISERHEHHVMDAIAKILDKAVLCVCTDIKIISCHMLPRTAGSILAPYDGLDDGGHSQRYL